MAATVLHFGTDLCSRLPVLNNVGYSVEVCSTLPEFRTIPVSLASRNVRGAGSKALYLPMNPEHDSRKGRPLLRLGRFPST